MGSNACKYDYIIDALIINVLKPNFHFAVDSKWPVNRLLNWYYRSQT